MFSFAALVAENTLYGSEDIVTRGGALFIKLYFQAALFFFFVWYGRDLCVSSN